MTQKSSFHATELPNLPVLLSLHPVEFVCPKWVIYHPESVVRVTVLGLLTLISGIFILFVALL